MQQAPSPENFCYRGQSNAAWELEEGLFRESNNFNSYEQLYRDVSEKIILSPYSYYNSSINQLLKMQHYGVPTRLLDWTKNPLVALFFACNDINQENNNGKVFIISSSNKFIAEYLKNQQSKDRYECLAFNAYYKFGKFDTALLHPQLKPHKEFFNYINEGIYFYEDKLKTIREKNESSIVSINLCKDKSDGAKHWNNLSPKINTITIDKKDKKEVIQELKEIFNIWELAVYPDNLDKAVERIKNDIGLTCKASD